MKSIAVTKQKLRTSALTFEERVKLGKEEFNLVAFDVPVPEFDEQSNKNSNKVLVKILAFSCNFRDRGILLENLKTSESIVNSVVSFGSDFVGKIIACGSDVKDFAVGDKVLPVCSYPMDMPLGVLPGVATNFASRGWVVLDASKIIKVGDFLSIAELAALPIGIQTAMGFISKSGVSERDEVLLFSARSNTSLFIAQVLQKMNISVVGVSSTRWTDSQILKNPYSALLETTMLEDYITEFGCFDYAFDPFFDLNIKDAISCLKIGGMYVTCGLYGQHPSFSDLVLKDLKKIRSALAMTITKNIRIQGNCLGTFPDYLRGLEFVKDTGLHPIIYSVHDESNPLEFFQDSFILKEKIGKTIMLLKEE